MIIFIQILVFITIFSKTWNLSNRITSWILFNATREKQTESEMWLFNDISKISFSISPEHTRVTWLVVTLKTHSPGLSVSCNTLVQADGSGDTDVTRDNHYKTWGRERSSLVSAGRNDSPHSLADSTVVFFANSLCSSDANPILRFTAPTSLSPL